MGSLSLSRRFAIAVLGALAIVVLWPLFCCVSDPCYLHIHGKIALTAQTGLLAGWLFIFLAGNRSIKITLVALTIFGLVFRPLEPGNIPATAESIAVRTLRLTADGLEKANGQTAGPDYPPTVTLAPEEPARRFYRFEYLPLASKSGKAIDSYILKARPLRYGCGITRSFLRDRNGRFHTTQEDRDATDSDPILD